jgi:hypothetical protein
MDKAILVDKDIKDGESLIRALDRSQFTLSGALWFYFPKAEEWRLMLVSPLVDKIGPQKSYRIIQSVIEDFPSSFGISIINISVISPKSKLIQLLRMAIHTGPGISEIRFSRNTIDNVFIEDALIYRLT